MPLLQRYLNAAFAYGALHSAAHLYDRQGLYAHGPKQLLVADKLALGLMLISGAPVFWPVLAHHDLGVLESCWTHRRYELQHPFIPPP